LCFFTAILYLLILVIHDGDKKYETIPGPVDL
jgi:hypothetical protein